jgi:hypothetical protein
VAGVLAVDVLFAFTGVRGTVFGAVALCVASAVAAAVLLVRRPRSGVAEGA